ncbi:hypothetical protein H8356DRAFT_1322156 [Neocallimastix lanati (nom. inval.)]|nr:hypothetical protein H8356DRAFT_1322156 [Neocallimastix sp. JGI-2020a]
MGVKKRVNFPEKSCLEFNLMSDKFSRKYFICMPYRTIDSLYLSGHNLINF